MPLNNASFASNVVTGTPSGAISVTGPTILYTPASGKRVRLRWVHASASQDNTAEVVATIKIGATTIYQVPLGNPGVFAHSSIREGDVDEKLTLTLSASGRTVYVNFDVEEFD